MKIKLLFVLFVLAFVATLLVATMAAMDAVMPIPNPDQVGETYTWKGRVEAVSLAGKCLQGYWLPVGLIGAILLLIVLPRLRRG
jgi:hypothetical protein